MSEPAYELPADDPAAAAEAVRRAAAGERVQLVRDGHAVVDVVPHHSDVDRRALDVEDAFLALGGGRLPTVEDYRRRYDQLGIPYPGDAQIRASFPVAS